MVEVAAVNSSDWYYNAVGRVRVQFYPYCSAEKLICNNLFSVGPGPGHSLSEQPVPVP